MSDMQDCEQMRALWQAPPLEKVGRLSSVSWIIRLELADMNNLFIGSADELNCPVVVDRAGDDIWSTSRWLYCSLLWLRRSVASRIMAVSNQCRPKTNTIENTSRIDDHKHQVGYSTNPKSSVPTVLWFFCVSAARCVSVRWVVHIFVPFREESENVVIEEADDRLTTVLLIPSITPMDTPGPDGVPVTASNGNMASNFRAKVAEMKGWKPRTVPSVSPCGDFLFGNPIGRTPLSQMSFSIWKIESR